MIMTYYQNQYLITSKLTTLHEEFITYKFGSYYIYAHTSLSVIIKEKKTKRIALIGIAIDPVNPMWEEREILNNILDNTEDFSEFSKSISALTGRFVSLYSDTNNTKVVGDACHLRRICYGKYEHDFIITSSPKLFLDTFKLEHKISEEKADLIHNQVFNRRDNAWYGYETIEDRLLKLLPNHYLIVEDLEAKRLPAFRFNWSEEEALQQIVEILENTYLSLSLRFRLMQPLTAGWESRLLLAASKNVRNQIQYYVFASDHEFQDARIPLKLSEKIDINFKVINTTREFDPEFLKNFKAHHILPRITNKTKDIQYHYLHHRYENTINLTGNVGDLISLVYGYSRTKNPYIFKSLTSYRGITYVDNQINEWLDSAKKYSSENRINVADLYYWEQRMGHWGSQYPSEQDIAFDEIAPLNNRTLLVTLLDMQYKRRRDSRKKLIADLITIMWPELLSFSINPDYSKLNKISSGNIYLRVLRAKLVPVTRIFNNK